MSHGEKLDRKKVNLVGCTFDNEAGVGGDGGSQIQLFLMYLAEWLLDGEEIFGTPLFIIN